MKTYKQFTDEEINNLKEGDLVLDVNNKPTLFYINCINRVNRVTRYCLHYVSEEDYFHRWCYKDELIKPTQQEIDEWKMKQDAKKYNLKI